ncbi:calcium-dependent protein kinase 32-like [Camellia sinensis]|uniref:calcium-dependent protein kinase 32-like n=1 Tax=Camellia sinensis TaxID=4442 RepID=UPI001036EC69|nr:calcium-dependent protein kinase 32-like [Camellia sinensis]
MGSTVVWRLRWCGGDGIYVDLSRSVVVETEAVTTLKVGSPPCYQGEAESVAFGLRWRQGDGHREEREARSQAESGCCYYFLADEVETNNEEVINAIMQDVDTDKDGRRSHEEFASMMKAGTDWRKASRQYSRETVSV